MSSMRQRGRYNTFKIGEEADIGTG